MTDIKFGRLEDLPLREAWKHEALQFTPWLAENIEHLSEVIGIPLELTGTEVAVESFTADILARNPMDDSVVLIENQLETTDHTHLGQIMTYLAGLEAHTVVWIAPAFREPHLSAIRWLNEHTADGFSFFAIKTRVVRIGDSPFAPIFEVVEKPNDWDRRLTRKSREVKQDSDLGERREAFWSAYLEKHPEAADWGLKPCRASSTWMAIDGLGEPAMLSIWIGQNKSGVFLRGARGEPWEPLAAILEPYAERLENELGALFPGGRHGFLGAETDLNYHDPKQRNALIDWFENKRKAFQAAMARIAEAEK
ncbi:hypothetical protein P1J78_21510 [Psychromarinibacter sp. C21-152]|uniref:DUF4268 domain-containing protein n=1 Tax=Psychromarinibacter sediminicola TaxID=3033385 RepID=A0AAE3NX71_9RHOB|nr:hypothetical protein [Psychromarinibacter sediminicola]MDF0603314.1 hypothetical protein [Psychromarinibacter sediminicola]